MAGQGWAGLGRAIQARPGRAGRAGPGRHRLELDLGSILGGQTEVDLGAIFGGPGGPGPGRAGTVWSSIWEPFWEAKLEVDLGAIFGGPNHLFSSSLCSRNRVHLQAWYGLGLCLDWARVRFLAFKKNVSE